ncbi:unnamed protein product [Trichogramma brassicae]|uniref:Uncharacterized protein n=1 Tax=Trichogramma brassicae TaxID=86971 RepID=A0A6H5IRC8_9HYME|nr:unnamed protein product [Trichogramma brassicae]
MSHKKEDFALFIKYTKGIDHAIQCSHYQQYSNMYFNHHDVAAGICLMNEIPHPKPYLLIPNGCKPAAKSLVVNGFLSAITGKNVVPSQVENVNQKSTSSPEISFCENDTVDLLELNHDSTPFYSGVDKVFQDVSTKVGSSSTNAGEVKTVETCPNVDVKGTSPIISQSKSFALSVLSSHPYLIINNYNIYKKKNKVCQNNKTAIVKVSGRASFDQRDLTTSS